MKSFKPTEYKVIGIHHEFDILIKNKRIVNKLREIIHLNNSYNPNCSFKTINLLSKEPGADTLNHEFTIKLNVSNPDTTMNTIYEFLNRYIALTYHVLGVDIIQPSSDDACVKVEFIAVTRNSDTSDLGVYDIVNDKVFKREVDMDNFCWDLLKKMSDLTFGGEIHTPEHINDNTQTFVYIDMNDSRRILHYNIKPKNDKYQLLMMTDEIWFTYVNTIIDYLESNTKYAS